MNRVNLLLEIGAEKPFRVLFAADTHTVFVNEKDNSRKHELAEGRQKVFPHAAEYLDELGRAAEEENTVILHAGDLIDFVSEGNLEAAARFTASHDVFMAAGNHEFSQYVGEAWEDAAYREQSLAKVQSVFRNDIRMSARVINGVKFIALDNGYYLFEQAQLDFLRKECAEGLPVVLLMHTPLYTPAYHEFMLTDGHCPCGYLCGTPESEMNGYSEHRFRQQKSDEVTRETIRFITECKNIRCLLTGHNHVNIVSSVRPDLLQYTAGMDTLYNIKIR